MTQSLVDFWQQCTGRDESGRWVHPLDSQHFDGVPNTLNTHYPPSPFIGNVVDAPIIILGLNGRFSKGTAAEFSGPGTDALHLARMRQPDRADWRAIAAYYTSETNFGQFILRGEAAVVNGCTYRSPKWSKEPENQAFSRKLPSSIFLRQWLENELVPAARRGQRLVIAWRWKSWRLKRGAIRRTSIPV